MSYRVSKAPTVNGLDESQVVFGSKHDRVLLHPWDRSDGKDRSVYIRIGGLSKNGDPRSDSVEGVIVDRDEFIRAVRAVFPELAIKQVVSLPTTYQPNIASYPTTWWTINKVEGVNNG